MALEARVFSRSEGLSPAPTRGMGLHIQAQALADDTADDVCLTTDSTHMGGCQPLQIVQELLQDKSLLMSASMSTVQGAGSHAGMLSASDSLGSEVDFSDAAHHSLMPSSPVAMLNRPSRCLARKCSLGTAVSTLPLGDQADPTHDSNHEYVHPKFGLKLQGVLAEMGAIWCKGSDYGSHEYSLQSQDGTIKFSVQYFLDPFSPVSVPFTSAFLLRVLPVSLPTAKAEADFPSLVVECIRDGIMRAMASDPPCSADLLGSQHG